MTDEAQWQAAGGALGAYKEARGSVIARLDELDVDHMKVLYEHAPEAFAKLALPNLRKASEWLEWAIRMTVDEALETSSMSQRELAAAAGVALTTVQRWSKEPVMYTQGGVFGPGAIPDRRKRP